MSKNELSIWSSVHGTRGELGVFKTAAELRAAGVTDTVHPVGTGTELLALLRLQPSDHYDHVVIAGHGGTRWILDDKYGVTVGDPRRAGQVSIVAVGRELARITRGPSPADQRETVVEITEAGAARVAAVLPGHIEVVQNMLFDVLSDRDVRVLGDIMTRARDHMRSLPPRSAKPRRRRG